MGLIALYWIISCIAIYAVRKRNNTIGWETPICEHIFIFLLSPFALAIISMLMLYGKCKRVYYRNRPKPVAKRMRNYLKSDCVLDERNHIISIAEYNYKHGTDYSLDDVYGKKRVSSLSKEEKTVIMEEVSNYGKLRIQENIPHIP